MDEILKAWLQLLFGIVLFCFGVWFTKPKLFYSRLNEMKPMVRILIGITISLLSVYLVVDDIKGKLFAKSQKTEYNNKIADLIKSDSIKLKDQENDFEKEKEILQERIKNSYYPKDANSISKSTGNNNANNFGINQGNIINKLITKPIERELTPQLENQIKQFILLNDTVQVLSTSGSDESFKFANKIFSWMKENGFINAGIGYSLPLGKPIHGIDISKRKNTIILTVGLMPE